LRGFGSALRGELREESDIDFLIEVEGPTSSLFPGGLAADLEQLLGQRVDVFKIDALREPLHRYVLQDAIPL